jgi:hypothetical protein
MGAEGFSGIPFALFCYLYPDQVYLKNISIVGLSKCRSTRRL